ncbi:MAG: GtrA family protein [Candidatus Paceibacterota bacterium]|jgi:putative flippase GtrA
MKFIRWIIKEFFNIQFMRFILVGFLNTAVDFGILNILMVIFRVYAGWSFSLFKAISFVFAATNSYFLNKFWTFQKQDKAKIREFSRFLVISIIAFLTNVSLSSFLVNKIGPQFNLSPILWANLSTLITVGITILINFFGYKYLVFKKIKKD